MDDQVVIDAKRILLRYGAPINVLDDVSDVERVELARYIAKTPLPERERSLRQALADRGYMEPPPPKMRRSRAKPGQPAGPVLAPPAAGASQAPAKEARPQPSLLRSKPNPKKSKSLTKPAPQLAAKPVAKPAPKPAAAPKSAAKPAPKPAAKPAAKPGETAKPAKATQPVKPKSAAKTKSAKSPAKTAAKSGAKKKPAATKVKRKKGGLSTASEGPPHSGGLFFF